MRWFREFILQAPEDLNGFFAFLTVPPAPPFPETPARQEDVRHRLVLLRGHGRSGGSVSSRYATWAAPPLEFLGPMPLPRCNSLFDALYPPGLQ